MHWLLSKEKEVGSKLEWGRDLVSFLMRIRLEHFSCSFLANWESSMEPCFRKVLTQLLFWNESTNVQCWRPEYQLLSISMSPYLQCQSSRFAPVSCRALPCFHEPRNGLHSTRLCTYNPAKNTSINQTLPIPSKSNRINNILIRILENYHKLETVISLLFGDPPPTSLVHPLRIFDCSH